MTKRTSDLVVSQVSLSAGQISVLAQPTPQQFIKTKPGRGGRSVTFVQGGYVIAQLNRIFGPLNWSFKVTERGETQRKNEKNAEGEVWVYGELTVHDHKRGLAVAKGQYGQHPIHANVPIGDALKAAGTDALKKCASLFGVALDVYWAFGLLDTAQQEQTVQAPAVTTVTVKEPAKPASVFEQARNAVASASDPDTLRNYLQRIDATVELTFAQKHQLKKAINEKLGIT